MKIAVVIKTNLKYDGRVLAQLWSIEHAFPESETRLFLLPDSDDEFNIPEDIKVKRFELLTRSLPKTGFFKFFKMLEFSLRTLLNLLFYKPDLIHVHDENSLIGPLLYKQLNSKVKFVYDDHELINCPPASYIQKLMYFFEKKAYQISDIVIAANESRARIAEYVYNAKSNISIIPNYLFSFEKNIKLSDSTKECLNKIEKLHDKNLKVILHQGVLSKGRDLSLIHKTLNKLSGDWVMFFIGCSKEDFDAQVGDYSKSHFGGFVDYDDLSNVWSACDAVMICYNNDTINNKYCAPNRLYLALTNELPVLINNNYELNRLNELYSFGINVENNSIEIEDDNFKTITKNYKSNSFRYNNSNHPIIDLYKKLLEN